MVIITAAWIIEEQKINNDTKDNKLYGDYCLVTRRNKNHNNNLYPRRQCCLKYIIKHLLL